MKKISAFLAVFAAVCLSCSKENAVIEETADVSFEYVLPSGNSMTRASADEIYINFYNKYVKTGIVLPSTYSLTVKNADGNTVMVCSGQWDKKQRFKLGVGKFHITGTSTESYNNFDYFKKAPLAFDEEIEVTASTTSVILSAKYDCFLVMFDATDKDKAEWFAGGEKNYGRYGDIPKLDGIYYLFPQDFQSDSYIKWTGSGTSNETVINMFQYTFKKGYYYYFEDAEGGFYIPPMERGNI